MHFLGSPIFLCGVNEFRPTFFFFFLLISKFYRFCDILLRSTLELFFLFLFFSPFQDVFCLYVCV